MSKKPGFLKPKWKKRWKRWAKEQHQSPGKLKVLTASNRSCKPWQLHHLDAHPLCYEQIRPSHTWPGQKRHSHPNWYCNKSWKVSRSRISYELMRMALIKLSTLHSTRGVATLNVPLRWNHPPKIYSNTLPAKQTTHIFQGWHACMLRNGDIEFCSVV